MHLSDNCEGRGENHAKTLQTWEKREKHETSKVKVQSLVQCLQYALNTGTDAGSLCSRYL